MGADSSDAGGVVVDAGCSCMPLLPVSDGMSVLKGIELAKDLFLKLKVESDSFILIAVINESQHLSFF